MRARATGFHVDAPFTVLGPAQLPSKSRTGTEGIMVMACMITPSEPSLRVIVSSVRVYASEPPTLSHLVKLLSILNRVLNRVKSEPITIPSCFIQPALIA